jgi:hypothetical protein
VSAATLGGRCGTIWRATYRHENGFNRCTDTRIAVKSSLKSSHALVQSITITSSSSSPLAPPPPAMPFPPPRVVRFGRFAVRRVAAAVAFPVPLTPRPCSPSTSTSDDSSSLSSIGRDALELAPALRDDPAPFDCAWVRRTPATGGGGVTDADAEADAEPLAVDVTSGLRKDLSRGWSGRTAGAGGGTAFFGWAYLLSQPCPVTASHG